MVRTGLFSLSWLGITFVLTPGPLPAEPPPDNDAAVQTTLVLQQTIQKARFLFIAGENKKAVDLLEEQLPRVNGNAAFLDLLRKAYRAHIGDLWRTNNAVGAKRYLERLCILEPSAAQDASLRPSETATKILPPSEPKPGPLSNLPAKFFPNFALNHLKKDTGVAPAPAKPSMVRAKAEDAIHDEDPFALTNMRQGAAPATRNEDAQQLVTKAEEEFARHHFTEARILFEQAYQADQNCLANSKDRWAYCILNQVVDQLNQPAQSGLPLAKLQQQVQGAVGMAPQAPNLQETGRSLLREIEQRQKTQGTAPEVSAQSVQHLGRNKEGWEVTETSSFRIFHTQTRDQVEKIAAIAEKTRRDMYHKWFGSEGVDWSPKCELILHATGSDYSRMTGVSGSSPGHSRIERDPSGQRVVSRRMDLRCDNPGMLDAVLPHETTHVVLAGMFDQHHVPRWADEGIAVLTEPSHKVDQHRHNLEKSQHEGLLFGVQELMQLQDYPQPRRIGAFYAQSVCLVEFMTELRGPQIFTTFVRDGLREGYDSALRKNYGMDMNELQQRWQQRLGQASHVAARP